MVVGVEMVDGVVVGLGVDVVVVVVVVDVVVGVVVVVVVGLYHLVCVNNVNI